MKHWLNSVQVLFPTADWGKDFALFGWNGHSRHQWKYLGLFGGMEEKHNVHRRGEWCLMDQESHYLPNYVEHHNASLKQTYTHLSTAVRSEMWETKQPFFLVIYNSKTWTNWLPTLKQQEITFDYESSSPKWNFLCHSPEQWTSTLQCSHFLHLGLLLPYTLRQ